MSRRTGRKPFAIEPTGVSTDEINAEGTATLSLHVDRSLVNPFAPPLLQDHHFQREFAMLRAAERAHRIPGVDLRDVLPGRITHPILKDWLDEGEEHLSCIKGRADLVRRRRHYILRDDDSMPFDYPIKSFVYHNEAGDGENRLYRLIDEAEWLPISYWYVRHPATTVRPVRAVFRHQHVRAILDWKASRLDMWLSVHPEIFGGYNVVGLSGNARKALTAHASKYGRSLSRPRYRMHEVKFDSWQFWLWHVTQMN